jgi:hypothetical protein
MTPEKKDEVNQKRFLEVLVTNELKAIKSSREEANEEQEVQGCEPPPLGRIQYPEQIFP